MKMIRGVVLGFVIGSAATVLAQSVYPVRFDDPVSPQATLGTKTLVEVADGAVLMTAVHLYPTFDRPLHCASATRGLFAYSWEENAPCFCNGSSWLNAVDGSTCGTW